MALTSNVTVTIDIVKNTNELPPEWVGNDFDYSITVNESVSVDKYTNLMQLRARSQIENKQLTFQVNGDANKLRFTVALGETQNGIVTGMLQNLEPLDYEETTSYQVSVRASVMYFFCLLFMVNVLKYLTLYPILFLSKLCILCSCFFKYSVT